MKFEKHIIAMSGNEYLLKCEVSGKIGYTEVDISHPEARSVTVPCVDNVEFSNCELILSCLGKIIPIMAYKFESLAEAPTFLKQVDLNEFEQEAEEALFEELQERDL